MSTSSEEESAASYLTTLSTDTRTLATRHVDETHQLKEETTAVKTTSSEATLAQLTEDLQKISFGEPTAFCRSNQGTTIATTKELQAQLVAICNDVFRVLGPYNLEATYQRALTLELRGRGVKVLPEVEIPIEYKGTPIATRRVDLYLQLDQPVILELKAVVTGLKTEHLKQLGYYMTHLHVSEGYLINFPHLTGFPDDTNVHYVERVLHPEGAPGVSDRSTRSTTPRKNAVPTIVHVHRVKPRDGTRHTKKEGTVPLRDPDVVLSPLNARRRKGKANEVKINGIDEAKPDARAPISVPAQRLSMPPSSRHANTNFLQLVKQQMGNKATEQKQQPRAPRASQNANSSSLTFDAQSYAERMLTYSWTRMNDVLKAWEEDRRALLVAIDKYTEREVPGGLQLLIEAGDRSVKSIVLVAGTLRAVQANVVSGKSGIEIINGKTAPIVSVGAQVTRDPAEEVMNQMRKFGRKGPSVSESKPSADVKKQEPSSIEKRKTKVLASVASASAAGEDDESPKPKTRRLRACNKSSEKSDTASSAKGSSASKPKFRKPGVGTQVVDSVESTASKDREEIKSTSSRHSQPGTADSSEHRVEVDMTGTEVINQARAMRLFSSLRASK